MLRTNKTEMGAFLAEVESLYGVETRAKVEQAVAALPNNWFTPSQVLERVLMDMHPELADANRKVMETHFTT